MCSHCESALYIEIVLKMQWHIPLKFYFPGKFNRSLNWSITNSLAVYNVARKEGRPRKVKNKRSCRKRHVERLWCQKTLLRGKCFRKNKKRLPVSLHRLKENKRHKFFQNFCNVILQSSLKSPKWDFLVWFSKQDSRCLSQSFHAPSLLNHPYH